jgi:transcriptional regulator with XRE-family HTH domain
MNKTTTKPITSVTDLVSGIADEDFVDELNSILSERSILKSLIAARIANGTSQKDIADKLNCSQSRVSKLERGRDRDLRLEELAAYGEVTDHEFEIVGLPKGSTPVDRVKTFAFCIHRELRFMAALAKDDQKIAKGVAEFFGEALLNMVSLLNDAGKSLSDRPLITMQLDADKAETTDFTEAETKMRKRVSKRASRETVPA